MNSDLLTSAVGQGYRSASNLQLDPRFGNLIQSYTFKIIIYTYWYFNIFCSIESKHMQRSKSI
jgi:hypothetical protein